MRVEDLERLEQLFLGLGVLELRRHQSEELVVVDLTIHILVNVADNIIQLILCRVQTELTHDVA